MRRHIYKNLKLRDDQEIWLIESNQKISDLVDSKNKRMYETQFALSKALVDNYRKYDSFKKHCKKHNNKNSKIIQ
jgi:hypothetical protein